jgi:hypothetical protein
MATLWFVAACICILFGFISGFADKAILMPSLVWFVAAIAFNTLGSVALPFGRKEG